jgi:hypothetical protein
MHLDMAPLTPMSLPVEKIMEISIPHRYSCCSHAPLITISLFMLHFHDLLIIKSTVAGLLQLRGKSSGLISSADNRTLSLRFHYPAT